MDIERNLALEIINETIQSQSDETKDFIIDSDEKAEWALRKISEERAETQRYVNVCKSMIKEYEEKIRKVEENSKNKLSYFNFQLEQYFQSVIHKVTKTQQTYRLPSGVMRLKYQHPEFKRDDDVLLKWLKENEMHAFIKLEENQIGLI